MKRKSLILAASAFVVGEAASEHAAPSSPQHETNQRHLRAAAPHHHHQQRSLGTSSRCGSNWQDAHDSCSEECSNDESCGPGRYCFHYIECTPAVVEEKIDPMSQGKVDSNGVALFGSGTGFNPSSPGSSAGSSPGKEPAPSPSTPTTITSPNYMPSYIASLPVKPSNPTTPAPFTIPLPTPNTKSNPTNNFCGYGWESANTECYHACPSGLDNECPGGRTCHSWMTCTQAKINPATFNVCGRNWSHAASTCATRCYLGNDDDCPSGETCFGGVESCGEKLAPLTAIDVGLEEKSYTQEEIAQLLDEEIAKERDEEAMSDSSNWWCGTSWSNMLETCSKRCTTDEDCKPNAWTEGKCFRTTGGPDNCSSPGVPVRESLPEKSRWCGSTWNDMLESCSKPCVSDEDCDGKTCWEAPDTCQYIGVAVKEKSAVESLWCGSNYDDAMTSCHKACPGESDDECPSGMSCFSGSSCEVEGQPIVREGYKCGTSWDDASEKCGNDCQSNSDCDQYEECFAEVVCQSELAAQMTSGMFCGTTWTDTAKDCSTSCEKDEDCPKGNWCYWVECETTDVNVDKMETMLKQPTTEAPKVSCSAEVRRCPNGQFVGRAQVLNCEFYPCPDSPEAPVEEKVDDSQQTTMQSFSTSGGAGGMTTDLSGWGSTPLAHACSSDGTGSCALCEGDCNSDADCQSGLSCFSRGSGEVTSVPGCVSGGVGDKPGMDYCYTPFPPTTTTTSTTTTTTTTTTTVESFEVGTLDYAGECTASEPCGVCLGDCDNNSHCLPGLECFSRGVGSVALVPGCLGLGIAGMDYCHDPNAPIIVPPTSSPTDVPYVGCSAEIRFCPDGTMIRQDPNNDCEFEQCPSSSSSGNMVSNSATIAEAKQDTVGEDHSSSYCGYSVAQINRNCQVAQPCPTGRDNECEGMYVCIKDTDCGPSTAVTTTIATATTTATTTMDGSPTGETSCDDLCLNPLPSDFCPSNLDLPNCQQVGLGEVCEADGECATDDQLNNCGTYDIYARVVCGFNTPTQGQIMQGTLSPTDGPSASPTPSPTASPMAPSLSPTQLPFTYSPTIDFEKLQMAMNSAAGVVGGSVVAGTEATPTPDEPVSIADAIAANAVVEEKAAEVPTSPPIKEYESHAAAALTFDRSPNDGGNGDSIVGTVDEAIQPPPDVGSSEWYGSVYGDESESEADQNDGGWDFDSYFRGPMDRSSAMMSSLYGTAVIIGIVSIILACQ